MKIPADATSYTPTPGPLHTGAFHGASIRHTFRPAGTKDWLLIYTMSGSGLYRHSRGEFCSRAGDCTLYQPGVFQDYQFNPEAREWDLLYAHFIPRPDWISWLAWPEESPGFMVLRPEAPELRRRILLRLRNMVRLNAGSRIRHLDFANNALEETLLWLDSVNPRLASSQTDPRVRQAMDCLSTHLAEPFSEARISRAAGLSASRLRHLFLRETGLSPRRFLEIQRLRRAEELLVFTRQTITEIAHELGFENPFYFTLRFKKYRGESPRSFRQRSLGSGER